MATQSRRAISKKAAGDQHGIFQHFQSEVTDYATRERYLSMRGGESSLGRDTESLYNLSDVGKDSRVPTEYVAPHLSTRYSPDRIGVQARRVSDGVYQDPYTNKVYDYNEGFKTEDGRDFPGGSASLQSSLMRMANAFDEMGFTKQANFLDSELQRISKKSDDQTDSISGVLVAVATALDEIGLTSIANKIDEAIEEYSVGSKASAENYDALISVANNLDEIGQHQLATTIDNWVSQHK